MPATPREILGRIARSVKRSEAGRQYVAAGRPSLDGSLAVEDFGDRLAFVRTTATSPGADGYPGKWCSYNVSDGTLTDEISIYVREVDGGKLVQADAGGNAVHYLARYEGDADDGTGVWVPVTGASTVTQTSTPELVPPAGTGITATTVTINSNQNDYALPATAWLDVTTTANFDLTGIAAPSYNLSQYITNEGPDVITLKNNSGSSSAGNKFTTLTGSDVALADGDSALLQYDTTAAVWYVVPVETGGAPTSTTYNLTASVNNLALPAGVTAVRVNPDTTGRSVTGLAAGTVGQTLTVTNGGTDAFTLANQSGSSSFGNRITTTTGADLSIPAGMSADLQYDGVSWLVTGTTEGSGGGGGGTTSTNGQATLSSPYSVVSASFANAGLNVTLGAAGTYLLTCQVRASVSAANSVFDEIDARLYDTTAGSAVTGSQITVLVAQVNAQTDIRTATIAVIYTAGGASHVIDLQALVTNNSATVEVGDTTMTYTRLS